MPHAFLIETFGTGFLSFEKTMYNCEYWACTIKGFLLLETYTQKVCTFFLLLWKGKLCQEPNNMFSTFLLTLVLLFSMYIVKHLQHIRFINLYVAWFVFSFTFV